MLRLVLLSSALLRKGDDEAFTLSLTVTVTRRKTETNSTGCPMSGLVPIWDNPADKFCLADWLRWDQDITSIYCTCQL